MQQLPALWTAIAALLIAGRDVFAALGVVAVLVSFGFRRSLSRGNEIMICSFLILAASAIAWLLPPSATLIGVRPPGAFRIAVLFACAYIAAFRGFLTTPIGGPHATFALSIIAAIGTGGITGAPLLYAAYLTGLGLCCLLAMRAVDRARGPFSATAALITLAALGTTYALARALPPLHDSAQTFAMETFALDLDTRRSGFGRAMELGSLRKIIRSDAKVLRVEGPETDHLRGVVYDRYRNGRWFTPLEDRPRAIAVADRPPPGRYVEIQSIGEETARLFVPLQASQLGVPSGAVLADAMGVLLPDENEPADRIWFSIEKGSRPPIAPPTPADLEVPPELRASLAPLARKLTREAKTDRHKLEAIHRHLQNGFDYALEFERDESKEPIEQFLFDRRTGHCEYFASAMALLARTATISTRVAGGFLVTEKSILGDYWIVRQSNAHAWVEAWIDGTWVTVDPTPPSGIAEHMARTSGATDAIGDLIAGAFASGFRWLKARTVAQILPVTALALAFVFRTELRSLITRKTRPPPAVMPEYSEPWPALLAMLGVLERRGLELARGETLAAFAERAGDEEARLLLERYAAHRFGGLGDRATLESELRAWTDRATRR